MHRVPYGAKLKVDEGDKIKRGQSIAEWDPYTRADPYRGRRHRGIRGPHRRRLDGARRSTSRPASPSASSSTGAADPQGDADLRPAHRHQGQGRQDRPSSRAAARRATCCRSTPSSSVDPGPRSRPATSSPSIPRESAKTKDITGGLPRVAELFEAREPKESAVIAEIDGTIAFGKDYKNKRRSIVEPHDGRRAGRVPDPEGQAHQRAGGRRASRPATASSTATRPARHPGHQGRGGAGQLSRQRDPGGLPAQGVQINDKHIEVIVRQMLQKVRDHRSGRQRLPRRASRSTVELRGGERAR